MFENFEKEVHVITISAILGLVITAGSMEYVSTKNPTLPSVSKYTGERIRYAKVAAEEELSAVAEETGAAAVYGWVKNQVSKVSE